MVQKLKRGLHIALLVVFFYLLYVVVSGILLFLWDYEADDNLSYAEIQVEEFYSDAKGPDRVVLLEDGKDGLAARFNLIQGAEKSVKIANFQLETGEVSDIFYALLLETADKGIQITENLKSHIVNYMETRLIYIEEGETLPVKVEKPETLEWERSFMLNLLRLLVWPFDELL